MDKKNDKSGLIVLLILFLIALYTTIRQKSIEKEILSGNHHIYDKIYDTAYQDGYNTAKENLEYNKGNESYDLGYEDGYFHGSVDWTDISYKLGKMDADDNRLNYSVTDPDEISKFTPAPAQNCYDLKTNKEFIYSWNPKNFIYSYDNYEGMIDFVYAGIMNCTHFIYDESNNCIHFSIYCTQLTDEIKNNLRNNKTFYEAIIYDYNYCEVCFAPIKTYYSKE